MSPQTTSAVVDDTLRPLLSGLGETVTITMASVSKRYYSGKKDHHKRVTTESTDGHRKGELKRGS
jgi:hypothetical protein